MLGGKTAFLSQEMVWRGRKCCAWVSLGLVQPSLGAGCRACTSEHPEQPQLLSGHGSGKDKQKASCHPAQAPLTARASLADGSPGPRRVTP